jgi:outer membrane protein assembly factor BamB
MADRGAGRQVSRKGPWESREVVIALDAASGKTLWEYEYPSEPLNFSFGAGPHGRLPIPSVASGAWGAGNILFITSAYDQGSRAIRLSRRGNATAVEELWFTNRFRLMFTNGIRIGDHLYGTSGDFGPAFLGALDVRTGEVAWQERGFSRANLVHADGRLVILDEDGQLALAEVSPAGLKRLASAKLFTTTAWTVPTLVGTTLYARDRERIVALSLGMP